jgi:Kef-type K+ transport system membrane component KefB
LSDPVIIRGVGLVVIAAAVFVLLARSARVPTIVAYILAGLALGPVTGLLEVSDVVEVIAEVGIALLLFLVGLELSFDKIRDVGKVAVVAGLGQVAFTAAGGLALSLLLGFTFIEALFLATALTFSSTVVVVKLLDQKKELDSLYGRIAVGIFLVQDLVVIVVLTFMAGLRGGETLEVGSMARSVGIAFAGMGFLLVVAVAAARWILPRAFGWAASRPEILFIWSLCWCFLFVLAAETMGLSLEIGAFLAGISIAQLPYNHDLRRRVHPLMNFFIAVFFVSLGMHMELGEATRHWPAALVLSLFVLVGNPLIFMWIIARLGYSDRTSFLTSVTVAQISEFSFIFAATGLAAGLIGEAVLSIVAMVGLVTIAASAYMILYNHQLFARLRDSWVIRVFGAHRRVEEEPVSDRRDHVIVVGMNDLGRLIVGALVERGERVLAIDTDPAKLEQLPCETLLGSAEYLSLLEEAGLENARLLVSALQIEDTNNFLAYVASRHGVPSSIHAFDRSVVSELREIGVSHLMISKNDGIRRIAGELRRAGVLS